MKTFFDIFVNGKTQGCKITANSDLAGKCPRTISHDRHQKSSRISIAPGNEKALYSAVFKSRSDTELRRMRNDDRPPVHALSAATRRSINWDLGRIQYRKKPSACAGGFFR